MIDVPQSENRWTRVLFALLAHSPVDWDAATESFKSLQRDGLTDLGAKVAFGAYARESLDDAELIKSLDLLGSIDLENSPILLAAASYQYASNVTWLLDGEVEIDAPHDRRTALAMLSFSVSLQPSWVLNSALLSTLQDGAGNMVLAEYYKTKSRANAGNVLLGESQAEKDMNAIFIGWRDSPLGASNGS